MTSTAIKDIHDALNSYVQNNLPNFDAANTAFLGRSYTPEANTPYLALEMVAFDGDMITTGTAGVYQHKGILQVSCNWPAGQGSEEVAAQMDDVRGIFPNGLSVTTSGGLVIRFFQARPKPILPDEGWIKGIIHAPWFALENVPD